jgi:hypothetical protein
LEIGDGRRRKNDGASEGLLARNSCGSSCTEGKDCTGVLLQQGHARALKVECITSVQREMHASMNETRLSALTCCFRAVIPAELRPKALGFCPFWSFPSFERFCNVQAQISCFTQPNNDHAIAIHGLMTGHRTTLVSLLSFFPPSPLFSTHLSRGFTAS